MTDPETLRALLARIEGAAGADDDLFFKAWRAFGLNARWHEDNGEPANAEALAYERFQELIENDAWTDAALALVGRVMPGWRVGLNSDPHRAPLWSAQLKRSGDNWKPHGDYASTPALALLAALLRAKIAETDNVA